MCDLPYYMPFRQTRKSMYSPKYRQRYSEEDVDIFYRYRLRMKELEDENKRLHLLLKEHVQKEEESTQLIIKLDGKLFDAREKIDQLTEENARLRLASTPKQSQNAC